MLLPLVICPLGIVADFASGFPQYTLTHPSSNAVAFGLFVLEYPCLSLVIGSSVSKLVQTLRREPLHAPRGLSPALGAVAGLIGGALLIGTIAQAPAAGGSATGQAGGGPGPLAAARVVPRIPDPLTGARAILLGAGPVPPD